MNHYKLETAWARMTIRHAYWIIALSILCVAAFAYGARYITISSDYRYFFGEDNPHRTAFENLQNVYSNDDSVLITITPDDGQVFKRQTLEGLRYFTEQAWLLPFVSRVDSITNFQYSHADGDELIVEDLVGADAVKPRAVNSNYAALKKIALSEPLLRDRLIDANASVTGINIKMTFPGKSPFEVPDAAQKARKLAAEFAQRYPGHQTHLTGMVMLNDAFNEAGIRDATTLMPIMYLLITAMLFFILRSKNGVAATLGVIILPIIGAMGFSGWASIPITPPSSIAPTVIMTLAIAHSVHIMKTLFQAMRYGANRHDAIIESLRQNLRPVFLTSLTTVIGFLSLNFSDTPPFHDLGNITAIGVALAFMLSIGFLPAIISRVAIQPPQIRTRNRNIAARYAAWLDKRGMVIVLEEIRGVLKGADMVFITAGLGVQIPQTRINDQFVGYFDESIRFRPDSEYTIEHLTGIYQLNFDITSGETQGIADPHYLKDLQRFVDYLKTIDGVLHVSSVTDIFKRLNKNMHADDLAWYRLPEQRDVAAQYLLLYEMSLPYGLDLNNQINVDKSSSRVVVTLDEVPTSRILQISSQASDWLRDNTKQAMHAEATSPTVMFSHITERNIESMLWGTLIAFTLITITMMIALRSVRYGLISLLPNVIPAVIALGLWSLIFGEAGFSIAFVAAVTLGIIVDDTVHFLSKFNYARTTGHNTRDSVQYAMQHVGEALLSTSVILIVGFSVLMLSGFKLNFVLGAMSALTIAVALLVDFTFLPALLRMSDRLTTQSGGIMKTKYASYTVMAVIGAVSLALINFNAQASTQQVEEKARWVAQSADDYDSGFINQTADVTMLLENQQGQQAERQLRIKILEVEHDGDKSLTIFDTPRDVKGTAFLSFSHAVDADEQWLYLPSLKRIKRISSNNKSGPFMGSEFAYEDLSSHEVDKYTYRYIEAAEVHGEPGHVIERIPVDPNSGYKRQRVWIDGTHWRIARIEFFDRKNDLLKTLEYSGYRRYDNGKWRADTMIMSNHQSGKRTTLSWNNILFNSDLSARDFDKNALKRIR